ncbi:MAG TPA: glycoside hydrolase family 31 protein, partial [Microthrixaceae bacterium]|nr:glycoside hydrolase family 31 protein [Microthrixaceae bacterium]HNK38369.1 glycoside hydrolase family 31 protein [Microthrixaceae bacterium]
MAVPRSLMSPDPRARPAASVTVDRVRVTVLTPRLLRLEHAADRQFEDRGSTAVVNRRFTVPDFEVREHAGGFVLDTGEVTLTVTDASRPLTRSTTSARIGRGRQSVTWRPGDRARTNLGGTARTLDNCRGREVRELVDLDPDGELVFSDWTRWDLDPGLLSRDGWVVLDDSTSPVFDPDAGRPEPARGRGWPTARPEGRRQDLYLFAHGTDHRGALADAAALIGPQPLPPRYAFGYWYSRYWAYTDRDLLDIAERFDTMDVPVDVMVIDMDWHLPGWTGYSWDRRYFPDPTDTLERLHRRGLRVTLNVHPADGVGPHEDRYPEVARAVGVDPASGERIPFAVTDPGFIEAYFRFLHHPEEDRGVDFWWMDWQQGTTSAVEGLDPLPWLNELHWNDQQSRRPDRRPLVFSRWGGMGGGRYPIGFSGDTWSTWDSLALQPWFTATAANVGYGFWSHDIGGHTGEPPSPELYTRWMQFGAFSPVLRTHATKDPAQDRRFWEFADPHRSVMIRAVHRRYELVPYLYGQCRRAVDTGVSALRPMYHDHPDRDAAYVADGQYLLGDDLVVAPVVTPLDDDRMAPIRVWLPRGGWYDTALGETVTVRRADG